VPLTITAAQRDQLYERTFIRLSGIDSVYIRAREGRYEDADALAREFADMLRFLVDDLGWGERREASVSLASPPEVLESVARALLRRIEVEAAEEAEESAELRTQQEATEGARETCRQLLEFSREQTDLVKDSS
jgi:hypothetical protein